MEPAIGPPPDPAKALDPKAGGKLLPPPAETQHAARVANEVARAPVEEKKQLRIDQKLLMSEVQLLLAEKRTSYALLRTGVTVSLIPVSIWTLLISTSKLYNVFDVLWLLVPVMLIATALFLLGAWLILHALWHLQHIERTMDGLRKSDTLLEDLLYRERKWQGPRLRWPGRGAT